MKDIYLKAALVADALSLGPHWVYNQAKLQRIYPTGIQGYSKPASSYHTTKTAGDLTHYGDQAKLLQQSLKEHGAFDPEHWRNTWLKGMSSYSGYLDGATQQTLANKGLSPSDSNDLAGASRMAPLLDLETDLESSIQSARLQTSLTHGDPQLPDAAEFFIRAAYAVRSGKEISLAFQSAAAEGYYTALPVDQHLEQAMSLMGTDLMKASATIGLTCHLPEAFPLTLFIALQPNLSFLQRISLNGLAGGDTSARAMLLAILFTESNLKEIEEFYNKLNSQEKAQPSTPLTHGSNQISITTPQGTLSGIFELPEGSPKAYALFAHCFTCGKDFIPEKRITRRLAKQGIATLRIDFRGLGNSEGDFAESSFRTNIEDLISAAQWLETHHQAPQLLIGHSLGGAAVLASASLIPSTKAVATIGAPAEPAHVKHLFSQHISTIEETGAAEVELAGRTFTIGKVFLDDLENLSHLNQINRLKGIEKLILHSPEDTTVPLENAGDIYSALSHPKSFISLAGADHLLMKAGKAEYTADLIAIWSSSSLGIS